MNEKEEKSDHTTDNYVNRKTCFGYGTQHM